MAKPKKSKPKKSFMAVGPLPKYEIIDNGPDQLSSILILDGVLEGTEVRYGGVDMSKMPRLQFKVEIIRSPLEGLRAEDYPNIFGDILVNEMSKIDDNIVLVG